MQPRHPRKHTHARIDKQSRKIPKWLQKFRHAKRKPHIMMRAEACVCALNARKRLGAINTYTRRNLDKKNNNGGVKAG